MPRITTRSQEGDISTNIQAEHAVAVTPSDSTVLTASTLYIGTAGNVNVVTAGGETTVFTNIQGGTILPVLVTKVKSTSTTASNIVQLY